MIRSPFTEKNEAPLGVPKPAVALAEEVTPAPAPIVAWKPWLEAARLTAVVRARDMLLVLRVMIDLVPLSPRRAYRLLPTGGLSRWRWSYRRSTQRVARVRRMSGIFRRVNLAVGQSFMTSEEAPQMS